MSKFTPTELAMMNVLSDGKPHIRGELHDCLLDQYSPMSCVRVHLTRIRKKINPVGQEILCVYSGKMRNVRYQLVRLITTNDA